MVMLFRKGRDLFLRSRHKNRNIYHNKGKIRKSGIMQRIKKVGRIASFKGNNFVTIKQEPLGSKNKPDKNSRQTEFFSETKKSCPVFGAAFSVYIPKEFYPPKLSKCNISIGTPKLSSIFSTAFDIGPGPHI